VGFVAGRVEPEAEMKIMAVPEADRAVPEADRVEPEADRAEPEADREDQRPDQLKRCRPTI